MNNENNRNYYSVTFSWFKLPSLSKKKEKSSTIYPRLMKSFKIFQLQPFMEPNQRKLISAYFVKLWINAYNSRQTQYFPSRKPSIQYPPSSFSLNFAPSAVHACAKFYQSLLFPKPTAKSGETLNELKCQSCPLQRVARRIGISNSFLKNSVAAHAFINNLNIPTTFLLRLST